MPACARTRIEKCIVTKKILFFSFSGDRRPNSSSRFFWLLQLWLQPDHRGSITSGIQFLKQNESFKSKMTLRGETIKESENANLKNAKNEGNI